MIFNASYELVFEQAGKIVVDAVKNELLNQGHSGTGKLHESIEFKVKKTFKEISLQIFANYYGKYVNYGVPANKIPYSGRTGNGGTSKYIEALQKYVLENGFVSSIKDAKSMAFAIAAKHKKEGMPTKDSYKHSVTGKRTEFVTDAIDRKADDLEDFISTAIGRELDLIFYESLKVA